MPVQGFPILTISDLVPKSFQIPVPSLQHLAYAIGRGGTGMVRSIQEAKTKLTPVFEHYGISRAVLFGSVAKGTSTDRSDLDLLVDSNQGI